MQKKLNPGLRHRVRNAPSGTARDIPVVIHVTGHDGVIAKLSELGIDASMVDGTYHAVVSVEDLRALSAEAWVYALRGNRN
jgi:hypothetical protein